ncbi:pyruvate dehydrogenase complex E1 component subunit beta [Dinoroseobacter sp. PD6]|uniref:pyruvate dehydrogenase complex E1 component subunit beta n=1 Tax=Dinoroseobacter sp. PD6 TaxID=3028384 RepID=UPI00237A255E|nr:pyruvate dehydrogenase complex E1 component subunit beta [Dinoroseobacter sp. PD6]MDD9716590.1 pyruvate dehydrogenase complex E1 component subunit beta [Dinoroseobacter sp. PD6]
MATEILMPALSPTMEEGTLAKWFVKEGDSVSSGDILAEIETDKATMEFEAVDEGIIGKILVESGTDGVAVNTAIAVLIQDGETLSDTVAAAPLNEATDQQPAPAAPVTPARIVIPDEPDLPPGTQMKSMTVREALRDAMAEEMRRDENVFLMGEEVAEYQGAYKISQGLLDEFGSKRVIDTPITEHGFAGLAVGAAFGGLNPIVEFMTFNFAMQAIDQIINSAAKTLYMSGGQMGCPIVFRGPNGAAARVAAQHSQDYAAWYAHIPGLKVAMPYSASDAKGLLKSAIRDPNPVIFLENEILYGRSFEVPMIDDYTVPFGKARIWREGRDVTIVSFGIGMTYALEAADRLAKDGISAEVVDLRTLRPLDTETVIASVQKTNRCVTVEEGFPVASIGNHISAVLMQEAFDYLDAPVINLTGKDVPMPYAANLEKLALVTTDEVIEAVHKVTYR